MFLSDIERRVVVYAAVVLYLLLSIRHVSAPWQYLISIL